MLTVSETPRGIRYIQGPPNWLDRMLRPFCWVSKYSFFFSLFFSFLSLFYFIFFYVSEQAFNTTIVAGYWFALAMLPGGRLRIKFDSLELVWHAEHIGGIKMDRL